jgi:hypothetical protein
MHERHVFERKLRKENEMEKKRRRHNTFGGTELSYDTIDTISEDSEELKKVEEDKKEEEAVVKE